MAGETLNCPGVESVQGANTVIVDNGTQAVETTEQDGRILAFCPAFEQGTCARAKLLSPDDHKFAISPLCMMDSTARMLYPELRGMAVAVEPDSDKLSRITMVRNRDQMSIQPVAPVVQAESRSSFALPTAVVDRRPQPDIVSVSVFPAEPVDPEAAKELVGALTVEKDVEFRPFANAHAFLTTATEDEISQAYENEAEGDAIPVLLRQTINYSGIKGVIEVITDIPEYDNVENYYSDIAKPMGAVRWTTESNNEGTAYVALPVRLRITFQTRRFTQYMTLQQSLLESSFADGSKYYLSCSKDPDDNEYNREDFKDLGKGQKMTFTADETTDEDGSEDSITLPMDLVALRGLTMKFVDNPNFEEEDADEDSS